MALHCSIPSVFLFRGSLYAVPILCIAPIQLFKLKSLLENVLVS